MPASVQARSRISKAAAAMVAAVLLFSLASAVLANPEADVHFERALQYRFQGNPDAAIAEYRRGLEADPNSVDAHSNLGVLLLEEKGDVDAAISEFVTALGIDPECTFCQLHLNDAVALRNSDVDDSIKRGNEYYRAGQLWRAAAAYRIATYVAPASAEAHNSLAWTLYRLGDLNRAMAQVQLALKLKPEDPEYINTLACVLFDKGDLEASMAEFKRAIAHSKQANPADLYGLAVGFLSKGDKEHAIQNFKLALQTDPNFKDAKYLRDRIGMSVHTLASHDTLLTLTGESTAKSP